MKILSENEQKYIKLNELAQLKSLMYVEIKTLQKQRNNEMEKKQSYLPFVNVDYDLVNSLHERINHLQKVIENLNDYRDTICESIKD